MGGGRRIGRIVEVVCAAGPENGWATFTGLLAIGYAGVPKPGDEERIGSIGFEALFPLKSGVGAGGLGV